MRTANGDTRLEVMKPTFPGCNTSSEGALAAERRLYHFNRVFTATSTQKDIQDYFWPSVQHNIFSGFNATVMCYGQTGSGKTYTLSDGGLISGFVTNIFQEIDRRSDCIFQCSVSLVEIYKDTIYDLIPEKALKRGSSSGRLSSGRPTGATRLNFHEGAKHTQRDVQSISDVQAVLTNGEHLRRTAEHDMNARSSRSHCIFLFHLTCRDMHGKLLWRSKLTVVDLAGSERVSKTRSSGSVFKEGIAINVALSALADVVSALARKSPVVVYRQNLLTLFLRESLINSYFALICCCSSSLYNLDETLNTLHFASVARKVEITRTRSVAPAPRTEGHKDNFDLLSELQAQRDAFRSTVERLQLQLAEKDRRIAELETVSTPRSSSSRRSSSAFVRSPNGAAEEESLVADQESELDWQEYSELIFAAAREEKEALYTSFVSDAGSVIGHFQTFLRQQRSESGELYKALGMLQDRNAHLHERLQRLNEEQDLCETRLQETKSLAENKKHAQLAAQRQLLDNDTALAAYQKELLDVLAGPRDVEKEEALLVHVVHLEQQKAQLLGAIEEMTLEMEDMKREAAETQECKTKLEAKVLEMQTALRENLAKVALLRTKASEKEAVLRETQQRHSDELEQLSEKLRVQIFDNEKMRDVFENQYTTLLVKRSDELRIYSELLSRREQETFELETALRGELGELEKLLAEERAKLAEMVEKSASNGPALERQCIVISDLQSLLYEKEAELQDRANAWRRAAAEQQEQHRMTLNNMESRLIELAQRAAVAESAAASAKLHRALQDQRANEIVSLTSLLHSQLEGAGAEYRKAISKLRTMHSANTKLAANLNEKEETCERLQQANQRLTRTCTEYRKTIQALSATASHNLTVSEKHIRHLQVELSRARGEAQRERHHLNEALQRRGRSPPRRRDCVGTVREDSATRRQLSRTRLALERARKAQNTQQQRLEQVRSASYHESRRLRQEISATKKERNELEKQLLRSQQENARLAAAILHVRSPSIPSHSVRSPATVLRSLTPTPTLGGLMSLSPVRARSQHRPPKAPSCRRRLSL
eukprot:TRINITY_DN3196_c0_g1_i1.p1 TRINITY_DN3196_c0_g1~~TRINITY_DN3196_c0_g1_i1.p1  ORF type:complete len:1060 (-),score=179.27 TRINITY_DN3196_c0_g1_i1:13-3192(-)